MSLPRLLLIIEILFSAFSFSQASAQTLSEKISFKVERGHVADDYIFTKDQKILVMTGPLFSLRVLSMDSGKELYSAQSSVSKDLGKLANLPRFDIDSELAVVSSAEGLSFLNVRNLKTLVSIDEKLLGYSFSKRNLLAVSEKAISLYDLRDGKLVTKTAFSQGYQPVGVSISVLKDDDSFVLSVKDKVLKDQSQIYRTSGSSVSLVASMPHQDLFFPKRQILPNPHHLVGYYGRKAKLIIFDLGTMKELYRMKDVENASEFLPLVTLSSDGRFLAVEQVSSENETSRGFVEILDPVTLKKISELPPTNFIYSALTGENMMLLRWHLPVQLEVFNVISGQPIAPPIKMKWLNGFSFTNGPRAFFWDNVRDEDRTYDYKIQLKVLDKATGNVSTTFNYPLQFLENFHGTSYFEKYNTFVGWIYTQKSTKGHAELFLFNTQSNRLRKPSDFRCERPFDIKTFADSDMIVASCYDQNSGTTTSRVLQLQP